MASSAWLQKGSNRIHGLLLDISGVLYNSNASGGQAIEGSIDCINRLKNASYPFKLCTNESQCSRDKLAQKLRRLGFDITKEDVHSPVNTVKHHLKTNSLRPYLIVHPDVAEEFADIDQSNPNCIVLGDATEQFSYQNLNKAFNLLINLNDRRLISLGCGRYYKEADELNLDVGPYCKALEFACGITSEIIGKPAKSYFLAAASEFDIKPENFVMIGDDIVNDVGGAQACGIRGVLVRTGKYRPCDEKHPNVFPDAIVDNLAQAVDFLLQST